MRVDVKDVIGEHARGGAVLLGKEAPASERGIRDTVVRMEGQLRRRRGATCVDGPMHSLMNFSHSWSTSAWIGVRCSGDGCSFLSAAVRGEIPSLGCPADIRCSLYLRQRFTAEGHALEAGHRGHESAWAMGQIRRWILGSVIQCME